MVVVKASRQLRGQDVHCATQQGSGEAGRREAGHVGTGTSPRQYISLLKLEGPEDCYIIRLL